MRCSFWQSVRRGALAWAGAALLPAYGALGVTETVSFQNGVNGYTGTFDRAISDRGGEFERDGSTVPHYFLDGFQADPLSADEQGMIRFDNLVGNGAGQIPSGATILDAQLTITTSPAGNAQSNGPWGVAALNQAFDSTTTYFGNFDCQCELISRGAWWQDGYSMRPSGGFGPQDQASVDSTDVTSMVQAWADGIPNHGMVIQSGYPGTADGWAINTTGYPIPDSRPKLTVTYTTDPIEMNVFQRDLNGYTGAVMARLDSGDIGLASTTNPDPSIDDVTEDGSTLDAAYLDGPQFADTIGTLSSHDQLALIRFNDVFGAGAGQAPSDVPVAKAWLVLNSGEDANARSTGIWNAGRMLRDWDITSIHSDFGDHPGLQVSDGDVEILDTQAGMITGSEVWFDVTSYLEGVRNGEDDFGLAVNSAGTADGWQIYWNGASDPALRPRLMVASGNPAVVVPELPGDYNENGVVDAADYVLWRKNLGQSVTLPNDTSPGEVTQDDYNVWRTNFGETSNGPLGSIAAVPEPGSWLLGLAAAVFVAFRRRTT